MEPSGCQMAIVFCSVLLESYAAYLVTNEAYYRMSVAYERTAAFFNRILAGLEREEGFAYGDKIAILGEFYYVDNTSPIEISALEDDRFREMSGVALENGMITCGVSYKALRLEYNPAAACMQIERHYEDKKQNRRDWTADFSERSFN